MILDSYLVLADGVTTTTSAASTDYIDTLAAGDANVGAFFVVQTGSTAFTAGEGAPTAKFELQTSPNSSFLGTGTETLVAVTGLLAASLVANDVIAALRIPPKVKRYLRGYYTVENAAYNIYFSACSYKMFIAKDVDVNALIIA